MTFQLVLTERPIEGSKIVGENVFLENLPRDCKVYLFYYPGAVLDEDLENRLRELGKITNRNLFVNIGRLNDPKYETIARIFDITNLPVIVMTANDTLASPPDEFLTVYARLDSKKLLESPERTIECVHQIFNLFIQGKVSKAIVQPGRTRRDEMMSRLAGLLINTLKSVGRYLNERGIMFSFAGVKFELKQHRG